MKLLVVGSGGREHAIVRALGRSAEADEIFVLPGNGGIAAEAKCVPVGAKDIAGIAAFAKEQGIDYAVVAPRRSAGAGRRGRAWKKRACPASVPARTPPS